jgi:hypothetical protein
MTLDDDVKVPASRRRASNRENVSQRSASWFRSSKTVSEKWKQRLGSKSAIQRDAITAF